MEMAILFLRLLSSYLTLWSLNPGVFKASMSFAINLCGVRISALAPQKRIGMFPNLSYPSAPGKHGFFIF